MIRVGRVSELHVAEGKGMDRTGARSPAAAGKRARSAAAAPDPEVSAKANRRRFSPRYKLSIVERGGRLRDAGRDRRVAEARRVVQFASVGVAQGGAGGIAGGVGEDARPEALGGQGGREEGGQARARETSACVRSCARRISSSRCRESIGAAGRESRRREVLLTARPESWPGRWM